MQSAGRAAQISSAGLASVACATIDTTGVRSARVPVAVPSKNARAVDKRNTHGKKNASGTRDIVLMNSAATNFVQPLSFITSLKMPQKHSKAAVVIISLAQSRTNLRSSLEP